jgi:hypothetical protein
VTGVSLGTVLLVATSEGIPSLNVTITITP